MKILSAESSDIPALYRLQLLAFESEAEMIGSRAVPALQETEEEHRADFSNWHTLKLETDTGRMIGAIRYKRNGGTIEVGRLMIHPDYRRQGLARKLLSAVDTAAPAPQSAVHLYKNLDQSPPLRKMGCRPYKEHQDSGGLSFVHLRKAPPPKGDPMNNCLFPRTFANLLFVTLRIRDREAAALFDTGAGMTVIARSLLSELEIPAETASLRAGNNNGLVRTLRTAVLPGVRIGGVSLDGWNVLVTDDADFAFTDDNGTPFPARILLGWDVISRFCWEYSAQEPSLRVRPSDKSPNSLPPDVRQGPIVFPEYAGAPFKARVDTGHTESTLAASWRTRLPDVEYHDAETVGIGSAQSALTPYVRTFPIRFQNRSIQLQNIDIGELCGQPSDIEALLGYDFLEGRDWQLDQDFRLR